MKSKKRNKEQILEDWEMEYQKNDVYLMERQRIMEMEWQEWEEQNKKPAKITLIKNKKKNEHKSPKIRRID